MTTEEVLSQFDGFHEGMKLIRSEIDRIAPLEKLVNTFFMESQTAWKTINEKIVKLEADVKTLQTQATFKVRTISPLSDTMTPFASRPRPTTANVQPMGLNAGSK